MHTLLKAREMLMTELREQVEKGRLTEQSLDVICKSLKGILSTYTIIAMKEDEERMNESRDGYSGRRTSRRRVRESMDGYYERQPRESLDDYYDGNYSGRRGYSRDEAKDKLIGEMEGMMGSVSPEAKHAIQKAIHALDNE